MQVVLDSVSLLHLLRPSKPSKKAKRSTPAHQNPLDRPMRLGKIRLAVDSQRGLISQWQELCGIEVVKVLITRWEELDGIFVIENPLRPKPAIAKRLRILCFGLKSPIDTLILRLALATVDRIIVSEDSDFWDPTKPKNDPGVLGNPNAPVARLCREELNVTILLLRMLMTRLR